MLQSAFPLIHHSINDSFAKSISGQCSLVDHLNKSKTEFLSAEQLHKKIESESNNIGFVLGKLLRELYDTTVNLFKKLRPWNTEDEPTVSQGIPPLILEPSRPQALILRSTYTNYPFENIFDYLSLQSFNYHLFLNQISEHYQINSDSVANIQEFCGAIEKTSEQGPVKLLIISGHGNPSFFQFGNTDSRNNYISVNQYLTNNNNALSCLGLLDGKVRIVIESCNVGTDNPIRLVDVDYPSISLNIQKLIAIHAPGSTVYAPDFYTFKKSLSITFSPDFQVSSLGVHSGYFYADGLLHSSLSFLSLLLDYPNFKQAMQRSFKKISPEETEFCQEVLPFITMPRYCLHAGVKPSEDAVQACEEDEKCNRVATAIYQKIGIN